MQRDSTLYANHQAEFTFHALALIGKQRIFLSNECFFFMYEDFFTELNLVINLCQVLNMQCYCTGGAILLEVQCSAAPGSF